MNNKILVYQKIIIVVYLTFCRLVACVFIFLLLGKRNLWWVFFFLNNKFSIFFAFWADRVRYETWGYVFIWTFNLFVLNILFPIWNDIFYPFMRILYLTQLLHSGHVYILTVSAVCVLWTVAAVLFAEVSIAGSNPTSPLLSSNDADDW